MPFSSGRALGWSFCAGGCFEGGAVGAADFAFFAVACSELGGCGVFFRGVISGGAVLGAVLGRCCAGSFGCCSGVLAVCSLAFGFLAGKWGSGGVSTVVEVGGRSFAFFCFFAGTSG